MQRIIATILAIILLCGTSHATAETDVPLAASPDAPHASETDAPWCVPTSSSDTILNSTSLTLNSLIVPGTMLAAGITGIYAFKGIRRSLQHSIATGCHTTVDNYTLWLPGAAYLTLGFIPAMPHRNEFIPRLMAGVTAAAAAAAMTGIMKAAFNEERPDGRGRESFPSAHTAAAFTGAELMRLEYGNLIGAAGYAVAITTGFLRIYNNRHWINDVIGGAAIGILSARIAYWLLPFERHLFRLDRHAPSTQIAIAPILGPSAGLSLALTF